MILSWYMLKEDGSIAFLDMLISPDENGRLNTTVYRKETHTDQYLHWDSHHAITSKYSVVDTLYHRARTVCSTPEKLQKEEKHLYQSLKRCKYPDWAINRVKLKASLFNKRSKKAVATARTNLGPVTPEVQNLTLWSHTTRDSVKATKTFARDMGLMYI